MQLTPHLTDTCPCDRDALIAYRLADDPEVRVDIAGTLAWGLLGEPGRIEAWALLEADDSTPTPTTPTTPRSIRTRGQRPQRQRRAAARRVHVHVLDYWQGWC